MFKAKYVSGLNLIFIITNDPGLIMHPFRTTYRHAIHWDGPLQEFLVRFASLYILKVLTYRSTRNHLPAIHSRNCISILDCDCYVVIGSLQRHNSQWQLGVSTWNLTIFNHMGLNKLIRGLVPCFVIAPLFVLKGRDAHYRLRFLEFWSGFGTLLQNRSIFNLAVLF